MNTYIKSPFPYAGCKYSLLDEIAKSVHTGETLVDMFGGSGVVSVNLADRFSRVIYNDIMSPLVYMHRNMIQDSLDTILENARQLSSKVPERYAELRTTYNAVSAVSTGIDHCAFDKLQQEIGYRFFGLMLSCTNNLVRFNRRGGFNQTCGKRQLTDPKVAEITEWKRRLDSVGNITIENKDFSAFGDLPTGTVVYADPPYSNTEAGYNGGWTADSDKTLAKFILEHPKYRWIVSSCAKDGNTSPLVETLKASGVFDDRRIDYAYKASKKTRDVKTEEIILTTK